jgi:hypothetical protein
MNEQWNRIQAHVLSGKNVAKSLTDPNASQKDRKTLTGGRHLASSWFAPIINKFSLPAYEFMKPGWTVATFADAKTSLANVPSCSVS